MKRTPFISKVKCLYSQFVRPLSCSIRNNWHTILLKRCSPVTSSPIRVLSLSTVQWTVDTSLTVAAAAAEAAEAAWQRHPSLLTPNQNITLYLNCTRP